MDEFIKFRQLSGSKVIGVINYPIEGCAFDVVAQVQYDIEQEGVISGPPDGSYNGTFFGRVIPYETGFLFCSSDIRWIPAALDKQTGKGTLAYGRIELYSDTMC